MNLEARMPTELAKTLEETRRETWRNLSVWLVGIPLAHGGFPWLASLLHTRHGWAGGWPGPWNLLGLIPVALGAAMFRWLIPYFLARPGAWVGIGFEWKPDQLLTDGPFALSRNPMHLAEFALWLGWTVFYATSDIVIGFLLMVTITALVVVPRDERKLAERFGEAYLDYKRRVPRWLGLPGR